MVRSRLLTALPALQTFLHHCPSAGHSHVPHPELPCVQSTFPIVPRVFKLSQHDARVIRHSAGFIQPFLLQGDPSIVARPAGHPSVYNLWLMA